MSWNETAIRLIPLSFVILAKTSPSLLLGAVVLKNKFFSSNIVNKGVVADGEIMGMFFSLTDPKRIPSDIPGQAAPMIPTILFSLIVLFTDLMLDVSHFVSILIKLIFSSPFKNIFEEFASETANSAEDAILGTIDSVGPVKPRAIPIVISFAWISV